MLTIATHNGKFHADDVFSVATLSIVHAGEKLSIVRTRDQEIIKKADIVVDVGTVYDPLHLRFDHHQEGGAGKRENGIPYAAFGLVWKSFGPTVCGTREVAERIDQILVQPIDANDNGVLIAEPKFAPLEPYTVSDIAALFLPTWDDTTSFDDTFMDAVSFAKEVIGKLIKREQAKIRARSIVEKAYKDAPDKRIIVLSGYYPWHDTLLRYPEPLFVIYPSEEEVWRVMAVKRYDTGFEVRKALPLSWAGKRDQELAEITGVPDAVFAHNARFLAGAKSKEGALKLAQIALHA